MKSIPMSRSEVVALRKDECLQLMERLGEAQPRRGVLVLELKSIIKDLPLTKGGEQGKPLLGFAKMNRSQLAGKARQPQIPVCENHTRGHLIKIIRDDLMQQSTPKGSDYQGFGKYGAKKYQEVLQMDCDCCNWVDQVEVPQSLWKHKRFSTWLKMQSVLQETNLENNMTRERMTRRIKQLEEEKLFAEMQTSKELDQRRKTPKQKGATSNTGLEEENNALKEQLRKLTEQVQLLLASSQEHGAASSAENSAE